MDGAAIDGSACDETIIFLGHFKAWRDPRQPMITWAISSLSGQSGERRAGGRSKQDEPQRHEDTKEFTKEEG